MTGDTRYFRPPLSRRYRLSLISVAITVGTLVISALANPDRLSRSTQVMLSLLPILGVGMLIVSIRMVYLESAAIVVSPTGLRLPTSVTQARREIPWDRLDRVSLTSPTGVPFLTATLTSGDEIALAMDRFERPSEVLDAILNRLG